MKVLVTGGTGFVGSHCVASILAAGHQARLFVRDASKVKRALGPLGATDVEVAEGDLRDGAGLEAALEGCDAVLHAANVYSTDPRRREEIHTVNLEGTDRVLTLAEAAGCDPIIHVSSVVALWPSQEPVLHEDAPVGHPRGWYSESKAEVEALARRHQDKGAPVVITNPGGVWGPHDPGPGEMVHLLNGFLGNRFPFHFAHAGVPVVDVRWLGRVHAALLAPGLGPRRILCGGHLVDFNDLFETLRALTGRLLPTPIPTPGIAAEALGWVGDHVQDKISTRLPFSFESAWLTLHAVPTDDHIAQELVGDSGPTVEQTLADSIVWAVEAGYLPAAWAGKLMEDHAPAAT